MDCGQSAARETCARLGDAVCSSCHCIEQRGLPGAAASGDRHHERIIRGGAGEKLGVENVFKATQVSDVTQR